MRFFWSVKSKDGVAVVCERFFVRAHELRNAEDVQRCIVIVLYKTCFDFLCCIMILFNPFFFGIKE